MSTTTRNQQIVYKYTNELKSTTAIGREMGMPDSTVWGVLKKEGVRIRSHSEAGSLIYPFWESAFSELTHDALYWAGFLMADGCIRDRRPERQPSIVVVLQRKDKEHLYKLKRFLESSSPVREDQKTGSYQLFVTSEKAVNDLAQIGIVSQKTLKKAYIPPARDDAIYSRDFWRGLVDGDGSITRNRGYPVFFVMSASKQLLSQFQQFLERNNIYGHHIRHKSDKRNWQITCYSQRAIDIIRLLYKDADTYLDRKYQTACELLSDKRYI